MTYLSDEDREELSTWNRDGAYTCACQGDRCTCDDHWTLFDAVESLIVRHRAQELREAAKTLAPLLVQPTLRAYVQHELIARANALDPKDGAR